MSCSKSDHVCLSVLSFFVGGTHKVRLLGRFPKNMVCGPSARKSRPEGDPASTKATIEHVEKGGERVFTVHRLMAGKGPDPLSRSLDLERMRRHGCIFLFSMVGRASETAFPDRSAAASV